MKTKQEMESRSLYMPKTYWKGIDKNAEEQDTSTNQVIRRLVSLWLTGFLIERKEARPALKRAPSRQ